MPAAIENQTTTTIATQTPDVIIDYQKHAQNEMAKNISQHVEGVKVPEDHSQSQANPEAYQNLLEVLEADEGERKEIGFNQKQADQEAAARPSRPSEPLGEKLKKNFSNSVRNLRREMKVLFAKGTPPVDEESNVFLEMKKKRGEELGEVMKEEKIHPTPQVKLETPVVQPVVEAQPVVPIIQTSEVTTVPVQNNATQMPQQQQQSIQKAA